MPDRKTWTVYLYKGADVDPSYKRLSASKVDALDHEPLVFGHYYPADSTDEIVYGQISPSYSMLLSSIVVPGMPIRFDISQIDFNKIYESNYLCAKRDDNTSFYFGFIDSIDYVNDGLAKINWKVDYWATYKNKINISSSQLVKRAVYAPFKNMIDSRRTEDPEITAGTKNRLVDMQQITGENLGTDSDYWYIFYVMPKSEVNNYLKIFSPDDFQITYNNSKPAKGSLEDISGLTYKQMGDLPAHEADELDPKIFKGFLSLGLYDKNKNLKVINKSQNSYNFLRLGPGEIYASKNFSDILSIDLVAQEGFKLAGCELRKVLDLSQFTQVTGTTLYKFSGENYFYNVDNGAVEDSTFSNNYDKNLYREEIVVGNSSLNVDPSLNLVFGPKVKIFDSVLPSFNSIYSFYGVNGYLEPITPAEAGQDDPVVANPVNRSLPVYADATYGYYISHYNRINAEISNKLLSWNAQVQNMYVEYSNTLKNIASDFQVSKIDLVNGLETAKSILANNLSKDQENAEFSLDSNTKNAQNNNTVDQNILRATQVNSMGNLMLSNTIQTKVTKNSQATALSNLNNSNSTALDNTQKSQATSKNTLKATQATSLSNMDIENKAQHTTQTASNDQNKKNLDTNLELQKSNLTKQLAVQLKNLDLQKITDFVTGLGFTKEIGGFLVGALSSLIIGVLDTETATAVDTNNNNLQKDLADDRVKTQKQIADASLKTNLSNLDTSLKASKEQAVASNTTSINNLDATNETSITVMKASQGTAVSNLKASQANEITNLELEQNNKVDVLKKTQDTEASNLVTALSKTLNSLANSYQISLHSLQNSYDKTLYELKHNNDLSTVKLSNRILKAVVVAVLATNLKSAEIYNNILSSINQLCVTIESEAEDYKRGNWNKLSDGQGLAVKALNLLTPFVKVYAVQPAAERQIKNYISKKGALINENIPLKSLVLASYDAEDQYATIDYFKNDIIDVKTRQYVQTENCILEGMAPMEALHTLQAAFDAGVYISLENVNGQYNSNDDTDRVYDGKVDSGEEFKNTYFTTEGSQVINNGR